MSKPRVLTIEEARERFLIKMWHNIEYWNTTKVVGLEPGQSETLWRLEGLMHTTLTVLDGNTCIPGMDVIPRVPRADIKYLREQGENWFPKKDLAGKLAYQLFRVAEKYGLGRKKLKKVPELTAEEKTITI